MSPDSPNPSRARRAWRAMSALGCLLGASGILLTSIKWTSTDTRVDRTSNAGQKAICAVVDYADQQARALRTANPKAAVNLEVLATRMRNAGIRCTSGHPRR